MEKPTLTKEESELYLKIVKYGTMDDMFDFAYAVGRATFANEQLERITLREPNDVADKIKE